MNRKQTDKLMSIAFGDLKKEDAKLNQDELASLEKFSQLRADLQTLNTIPDHQLSNERLRDAVLGQGLKPAASPKVGFSWFWMPTAACLLAFAIVSLRPKASVEPKIMLGTQDPTNMLAMNEKFVGPTREPAFALPDRVEAAKPAVAMAKVEVPTRHSNHRFSASASRSNTTAPVIDTQSAFAMVGQVAGDTVVNAPTEETATQPGIVLIDQSRDDATTTPRATEVGNPANVVVGG